MRWELGNFEVRDVVLDSGSCRFEGGTLYVNTREVEEALRRDQRLKGVRVSLAKPGDRVRVVHVLDVVEPRVKVTGGQSAFPGFTGPVQPAGRGRTHRLTNVSVIQTVDEFWVHDGLSIKEAIVDMWGPAARYSPFSRMINIVVSCEFGPETDFRDRTATVVLASLRTAELLAETVRDAEPDNLEVFELPRVELPRVGYLCFLMTEGEVHRTYVYGARVAGLPTVMHPTEFLDGAIVSGSYHTASNRNVTFLQQNNPVIRTLAARHGRNLDFAGVIIAEALTPHPDSKQRIAQHCAVLAELLGLQGVILSKDSAGHATVEFMAACRELERRGIKTVLITEEFAGADGGDLGLVYYVPEADAMISTGNRDELINLPAMDRVIGGHEILNPDLNDTVVSGPASGAFETSLRRILCSANQVGAGRLTARTY